MIALILVLIFFSGCRAMPLDEDSVVDENSNGDIIDPEDIIDISYLGPEAYGYPSYQSGVALSQWNESSLMNPEEVGDYAEGDILMPVTGRSGLRNITARWRSRIIPYEIVGPYSQKEKDLIMEAIADYHRLTCLRFVPHQGEKDYISLVDSRSGCWSHIGRIGGRQEVNLQSPGCLLMKGSIIHELMHIAGFLHEQGRPDRDDYIILKYENMREGTEKNFRKNDPVKTGTFGVTYDYSSVMHYSEYAFSKNKQKTILAKVAGPKIGQREGFSQGDVQKLNNMYNCKMGEHHVGWAPGLLWQSLFGAITDVFHSQQH